MDQSKGPNEEGGAKRQSPMIYHLADIGPFQVFQYWYMLVSIKTFYLFNIMQKKMQRSRCEIMLIKADRALLSTVLPGLSATQSRNTKQQSLHGQLDWQLFSTHHFIYTSIQCLSECTICINIISVPLKTKPLDGKKEKNSKGHNLALRGVCKRE